MPATHSLARQLRHSDGLLPGRDTLRALLVVSLVAIQSVEVSSAYGLFLATPLWILGVAVPGALFALGGYALATSAAHAAPAAFFRRRGADLGPLVVIALLFAALAVGPAATEQSLRNYFADRELWLFVPNVLSLGEARLPGVFEFNNVRWTVIANSWMIVTTAAGCVLLALAARPRWRIWAAIGMAVLLLGAALAVALGPGSVQAGIALSASTAFLSGVLAAYRARDVSNTLVVAAGSVIALGVLARFGDFRWQENALFALAVALPVAFLTIYVAARRLPMAGLARRSWPFLSGLPLLAYPLQQLAIARGSVLQSPAENFALAIVPAMLLSAATHLVFRRLLARRLFPALAEGRRAAPLVTRTPLDWHSILRWRPKFGAISQSARAALPQVVGFALFVVVVLALMALMMLAMQRDAAGI